MAEQTVEHAEQLSLKNLAATVLARVGDGTKAETGEEHAERRASSACSVPVEQYRGGTRGTVEHAPDGVTALGGLKPDPGATLAHPWRGRQVDSPAGPGRLIWTDGFRAAISTEPDVAYFVDLEQVRLAEEETK